MKIGYILKTFPKISEKFILNEIVELIKTGHDVHIFSMHHPEERIIHKEKIMNEEISEYNLCKQAYYIPYNQRFILESIGYVSVLSNNENNIIYNRLCTDAANHFAKIIKDNNLKLDIIHAHFATEPTYIAMKLSKILDIPFTFMAHAFDIFINPDIRYLKEKCDNASAIITPSYYNIEYLHNLIGIDKDKMFVIRACPDIDELKNFKRTETEDGFNNGFNSNRFNILSISRLVEKKGIRYAILAVKELIEQYPEINYKIIGSGPLEKDLKILIRSLEIENNVKIIGNLDNNALMEEFSKTTAFILPCTKAKNGDMDGIPVSLMEAMYLQIPTISTRVSGIPELIENNVDGLLVNANDVKQLSDAIRNLLEDRDFRIKIGNNGRQKIDNDFNIHKEVKKLIGIWNNNGI